MEVNTAVQINGITFVNQLIARRLMFNWCATQDHKMSALCVSFSDLGRILRLLLLQSAYRYRTKVLGWLLQILVLDVVC